MTKATFIFVLLFAGFAQAQESVSDIKGDWLYATYPATYSGDMAGIAGTTTTTEDGLRISKIAIRNFNDQPITDLSLQWALVEAHPMEDGTETFDVIDFGRIDLVVTQEHPRAVDDKHRGIRGIRPGKTMTFDPQMPSFLDLAPQLMDANGQVNGTYRIIVGLETIDFNGDMIVAEGLNNMLRPNPAKAVVVSNPQPVCPKQKCDFEAGAVWTCSNTNNWIWCSVQNQGRSCVNTTCDMTVEEGEAQSTGN